MAAKLVEELQAQIICSICKHYYTNPISIQCGHTFCQDCFIQQWEGESMSFFCPECKNVFKLKHFPSINIRMDNITGIGKELRYYFLPAAEGQSLCPIHQKPLELFCEEDQIELCVVCSQNQEHQLHKLGPIKKMLPTSSH